MAIERKKSIQFVQAKHGTLRMRIIDQDNIHVYDTYGKLRFAYNMYNGWRKALSNGDFDDLNDDDLHDELANVAQVLLFKGA